jgi:hypothetical protein
MVFSLLRWPQWRRFDEYSTSTARALSVCLSVTETICVGRHGGGKVSREISTFRFASSKIDPEVLVTWQDRFDPDDGKTARLKSRSPMRTRPDTGTGTGNLA